MHRAPNPQIRNRVLNHCEMAILSQPGPRFQFARLQIPFDIFKRDVPRIYEVLIIRPLDLGQQFDSIEIGGGRYEPIPDFGELTLQPPRKQLREVGDNLLTAIHAGRHLSHQGVQSGYTHIRISLRVLDDRLNPAQIAAAH